MKVVSLPKERIHQSRRQLIDFLKLTSDERVKHFRTTLKPAILRLLNVVSDLENASSFEDLDLLRRDALHVDIEIVAFCFGETRTVSYIALKSIPQLVYPEFQYQILDRSNGACKDMYTESIYYYKRIAIDFAIEELAKLWISKIPKILELL